MRHVEKKKWSNQSSSLCNADRENILHWKLAEDHFKTSLQMLKTEKREEFVIIGKGNIDIL